VYCDNLLDIGKASIREEFSRSINPVRIQELVKGLFELILVLRFELLDHPKAEWNACRVELVNADASH